MGNPWAKVKGKKIAVGVQGSNSLELSVWLQSLHLHLGQITQRGLPSTSVCMTNHCDRASLQLTQPNIYSTLVSKQRQAHMDTGVHILLWSPKKSLGHCTASYYYYTWQYRKQGNFQVIGGQLKSQTSIFVLFCDVASIPKGLQKGKSLCILHQIQISLPFKCHYRKFTHNRLHSDLGQVYSS